MYRLVLLQKSKRELVTIRDHAAAQEETFKTEIARAKKHRARQEEEQKFSIAFAGVLGVDSMGIAYGGRVMTGESAMEEFDLGMKEANRYGRVGRDEVGNPML